MLNSMYWTRILKSEELLLDSNERACQALRKSVEPTDAEADAALEPRWKAMGMNASVGPVDWNEPLDISIPRGELKHVHDRIRAFLRAAAKDTDGTLLAGQREVRLDELVEEAEHWERLIRRREDESGELYLAGDGLAELVRAKLLALQDQRRGLQERLAEARARAEAQDSAGARHAMLAGYVETLKAMLAPDADDEARRALVATLVEKVTMGDGGPTVHFSFAVPPLGNCPRPHSDDSPGVAARAPPSGPRLPLPGLRAPVRPRTSPPPLGARRPYHAFEPRFALSPAPSRGTRGGLSRRSAARWRAPIPAAGRPAPARGPGAGRGARRSGAGTPRTARGAGLPRSRAHCVPGLAGGAPGSGLGDRRPASPGHARRRIFRAGVRTGFDGTAASAGRLRA